MSSRKKASLNIFLGSGINSIIVTLQALVLIPLYLEYIGSRLYGAWLGSKNILIWLLALDLGLPNYMIQRIGAAHGKGDEKSIGEYFASGMLVLSIISIIIVAIGICLSFFLPGWMGIDGVHEKILRQSFIISVIAQGINLFSNGIVALSRGIQRTLFINLITITSTLCGFIVTLILILSEYGLLALAMGLLVISLIKLIGYLIFTHKVFRDMRSRILRINSSIIKSFLKVSPSTTLGGIGHALRTHSDSIFTAIILTPELATLLDITKKALQVIRTFVDMIPIATYGSFANLISSKHKDRGSKVYQKIHAVRMSAAIVMASSYLAVNRELITIWIGEDQYGGILLSFLLAVQFIISGSSFVANYLYRAIGPVKEGSLLLFFDSAVQILLTVGLIQVVGFFAIPISGIISGIIFGWIAHLRVKRNIHWSKAVRFQRNSVIWGIRIMILGIGGILGTSGITISWWINILLGGLIALLGGLSILNFDPRMADMRELFVNYLTDFRIDLSNK